MASTGRRVRLGQQASHLTDRYAPLQPLLNLLDTGHIGLAVTPVAFFGPARGQQAITALPGPQGDRRDTTAHADLLNTDAIGLRSKQRGNLHRVTHTRFLSPSGSGYGDR